MEMEGMKNTEERKSESHSYNSQRPFVIYINEKGHLLDAY